MIKFQFWICQNRKKSSRNLANVQDIDDFLQNNSSKHFRNDCQFLRFFYFWAVNKVRESCRSKQMLQCFYEVSLSLRPAKWKSIPFLCLNAAKWMFTCKTNRFCYSQDWVIKNSKYHHIFSSPKFWSRNISGPLFPSLFEKAEGTWTIFRFHIYRKNGIDGMPSEYNLPWTHRSRLA